MEKRKPADSTSLLSKNVKIEGEIRGEESGHPGTGPGQCPGPQAAGDPAHGTDVWRLYRAVHRYQGRGIV